MSRAALLFAFRTPLMLAVLGGHGCRDDSRKAQPLSPEQSTLDESLETPVPGDSAAALLLLRQAQQAAAAEDHARASQQFEAALAADPAHLPTLLTWGFAQCIGTGPRNPGQAVRLFRLARLLAPDQMAAVLGEGLARQALGDTATAEPLLREALRAPEKLPPDLRAEARFSLGSIEHESGRLLEAARLLQSAAEDPGANSGRLAEILVRLSLVLVEADRPKEAERALRQAIDLEPETLAAHYGLSRLLADQGRPDEAEHYRRIHSVLRQLTDHHSRRFQEDHELRVRLRRKLVEVYPEHPRARHQLIRELLAVGLYAEARKETGALVPQPDLPRDRAEVLYLVARAQAGLKDLEGARKSAVKMRDALQTGAPVPNLFRDILEEWQNADPSVTESTLQQTLDTWMRDS